MDEIDDDGFPVDEMTPDADAAGSDIADGDVADGDTTVVDVDDGFCHGWGDCEGLSVCDFALGRCEHRELLPAGALEVYTFKPSAAAAGDVIVLDGARFYYSLFGFMGMKVSFDDGSPFGVSGDENRVAWTYDGNSAGEHITLKSESGQATTEEPLLFANAGVIACDGKTPKATGVIPGNVDAAGPYAAAYFDLPSQNARLYYPAQCGVESHKEGGSCGGLNPA